MPKWGLTEEQRQSMPWGIDENWLKPAKTLTDPIHKNIYLNVLEARLVDSRPLQRLRGVRQLGTSHLVYPGATHSRFSHALGTLRAAQDLMDSVVEGLSGARTAGASWPQEWSVQPSTTPEGRPAPTEFDRKIAEATILARLGGLLHDLCHIPMGHTIEDDLGVLHAHDGNTQRFETLWNQIPRELPDAMGEELIRELRPLILSKERDDSDPLNAKLDHDKATESKYPFVHDIVGNTICADLMDYLRRDHAATGLPLALGDRFVDDFYVTPSSDPLRPKRMAVRISRNGHLRQDAVTELVKYLRYRYELSERVLYHHAKVAADAMVGKLLDMWRDALWVEAVEARHPDVFDNGLSAADARNTIHEALVAHAGTDAAKAIDRFVTDEIETTFINWSDDGLLTHLTFSAHNAASKGQPGSSRWRGVATLADMVLTRHLFKTIGRADSDADLADAKELHARYRDAEPRRNAEEGAALFAGIDRGWKVVVWVPSPKMRPKAAEVLVNLNGRVAKLKDLSKVNRDATAIVDSHSELWGVGVFVHPEVTAPLQRLAVLAWLKDKMGLSFLDETGAEVPSVQDLIVRILSDEMHVERVDRERLTQLAAGPSAKGGDTTFVERLLQVDALRKSAPGGPIGSPDTFNEKNLEKQGWTP